MIKVVSTNAEGLVREGHEGVFMNTDIANVRDFYMTSFFTPMVKAPGIMTATRTRSARRCSASAGPSPTPPAT